MIQVTCSWPQRSRCWRQTGIQAVLGLILFLALGFLPMHFWTWPRVLPLDFLMCAALTLWRVVAITPIWWALGTCLLSDSTQTRTPWRAEFSETLGKKEMCIKSSASKSRGIREGVGLRGQTPEDPPPHPCAWEPKPALALKLCWGDLSPSHGWISHNELEAWDPAQVPAFCGTEEGLLKLDL